MILRDRRLLATLFLSTCFLLLSSFEGYAANEKVTVVQALYTDPALTLASEVTGALLIPDPPAGNTIAYHYDMANRLTTVSYRRSELYYTTNFQYDGNGNLLTKRTEYSTVPFLESYRNSFETDTNGDGKPDGWNVAWRNGISAGAYATMIPYQPIPDGKNALRLYNGTGDAQSYQYIDSDSIPVSADTAYQVQAAMRYTLQQGGRASIGIIQFDVNGVQLSYDVQEYGNGTWSWKEHSFEFRTKPNAASVKIRMYVGGEESAYLDLDSVVLRARTMGVNLNASFEADANNNGGPDLWESSWRYGSSTGFFARRDSNAPHPDGQYEYRLYNGTGDPHA